MQGEDHEAVEWPNVEMVRCRDVGDLLHGHRCGYAGTNELACPNHIPCPGQMYVPLSRCPSPERLMCTEHEDRSAIAYTARCRECAREFMAPSPERDTEKLVEQAERALYKLRTGKPQAAEEILAAALAEFTAPRTAIRGDTEKLVEALRAVVAEPDPIKRNQLAAPILQAGHAVVPKQAMDPVEVAEWLNERAKLYRVEYNDDRVAAVTLKAAAQVFLAEFTAPKDGPERDTDGLTREERLIEEIKRFAWCTQCPACKARAEAVLDEFTAPKADER